MSVKGSQLTGRWLLFGLVILAAGRLPADDPWVVYDGGVGPGHGKQIVLIAGDEEYRSEECLPMLAKILAQRHGFRCTVLFSINPVDGTIDPDNQTNIPGLEQLAAADMMVIATRFRELPDQQMRYVDDFVESGKPILGLRTATHAFRYERDKQSRYARYDFRAQIGPAALASKSWATRGSAIMGTTARKAHVGSSTRRTGTIRSCGASRISGDRPTSTRSRTCRVMRRSLCTVRCSAGCSRPTHPIVPNR